MQRTVKSRLTPNLVLLLGLMLSPGCVDSAAKGFCPVPVYPDNCALDYLATLNPPQCAIGYFNNVATQQEVLGRECR